MSATFTLYNQSCYNYLNEKFGYVFEPELINEICNNALVKTIKEGELLIDIGQMLSSMPLVISGSIKIMTEDKEGNELLLYYLELGDTCAMTFNYCSKPAKSTIKAIAEVETEILLIPIIKFDDWMIKFKSWRNFVLESYNIRFSEMLQAIDNLAFNNMEERLYKYLRDKVMITKQAKLHVTHLQIANDLHSSRVVISRLMKKMENENKIIQHRNYVEVKEFM